MLKEAVALHSPSRTPHARTCAPQATFIATHRSRRLRWRNATDAAVHRGVTPKKARMLGLAGLSILLIAGRASADSTIHPPLNVRWGVGVGVVGLAPVGDDRQPQGLAEPEFEASLALRLEPLRLDIGNLVSVAAFADINLHGGVSQAATRALLAESNTEGTLGRHGMFRLGAGARFFPWRRGIWRPYLGAFGAFARTVRRLTPTSEDEAAGDNPFARFAARDQVHRHHGGTLLLALGLRLDMPTRYFGMQSWIPVHIELQWAKNFWRDRSVPPALAPYADRLAPQGMQLDHFGLMISVGLMP